MAGQILRLEKDQNNKAPRVHRVDVVMTEEAKEQTGASVAIYWLIITY